MLYDALLLLGTLWVGWLSLDFFTRRPDGVLVTDVPPYRRLLALISPRAETSTFQGTLMVDASSLIDSRKRNPEVSLTALLVSGLVETLVTNPKLNRFLANQRLYQRNEIAIALSVKRNLGNRESKVATIWLPFSEAQTPQEDRPL